MHKHRWDDLQFLNAVAEHGSLSAASRALGVNHSTVLRRIVYLEKSNEVQIFDREAAGYTIRPEGRILLGSLKLMQQAADRIERNLALMRKGISGTFRLSTTDSIANILLPTYLLNLREVYPHIRIEVEVSNKRVQMKNPNSEILIRAGAHLEPELHGEKVGVISFGIFGTINYLKNNPDSEIESHNWLGVKPEFAKTVADGWQISTVGDQVGFFCRQLSHHCKYGRTWTGPGNASNICRKKK